jgi:hypothetical protein
MGLSRGGLENRLDSESQPSFADAKQISEGDEVSPLSLTIRCLY